MRQRSLWAILGGWPLLSRRRDQHSPAPPLQVTPAPQLVVIGLNNVVMAVEATIADLEVAMAAEFDQHPAAELPLAAPGLGPVLAARVPCEVGDDTSRFSIAAGLRAFAGTAPITRASGRSKSVRTRHVKNKRLADACHELYPAVRLVTGG